MTMLLSRFSRVWLCDPIDGSPPGSPVPGILQARTLEWVAISFSNAWKWKGKVKSLSRLWLLATPWTAAYQAPPSMGFSRQEYWSGVPLKLKDKEFVCVSCHNKVTQTEWLQQQMFTETRRQRPRCQQGWFLLRARGGESVRCLSRHIWWFAGCFWWPVGCWNITLLSGFIFIWPFLYVYVLFHSSLCVLSSKDTCHWA